MLITTAIGKGSMKDVKEVILEGLCAFKTLHKQGITFLHLRKHFTLKFLPLLPFFHHKLVKIKGADLFDAFCILSWELNVIINRGGMLLLGGCWTWGRLRLRLCSCACACVSVCGCMSVCGCTRLHGCLNVTAAEWGILNGLTTFPVLLSFLITS